MKRSSETLKRATIGIALLVLASKVFGFIREAVIAYKFGTGIDYDVYLVAVSIPLVLYELYYASLVNLVIPDYARATASPAHERGIKPLWTEFNFSVLGAAATMVVIVLAAPQLIQLIAPGLDETYLSEAVFMTRISSILIIVAVLGSFFHAILNAEKRFLVPAASPIAANIIVIVAIVILAGQISTRAIMYGIIAGYLAQAVVMFVPFAKLGMLRDFHTRFIEPHIGKFFISAVAILIIEAAARVFAIVDRYFASYMESGIISALGYSYLLMLLPIAVFAYALSTAIFPFLSDAFAEKNQAQSGYLLTRGISVSLLSSIPATMIYWIFAEKLVIILFQRGAFDSQSVAYTAGLLKYFAWVFPGQFIIWIMFRAYYAARRLDVLIIQVVIMAAAKIALTAAGVRLYDVIGLPLASAASYTIGAAVLLILANRSLTPLDGRKLAMYFGKVVLAVVPAGLFAAVLDVWIVEKFEGEPALFVVLPVVIGFSLTVFMLTAYLLRIEDMQNIFPFRRRRR